MSCDDAIFATQEVIARYVRGGGQVFMCLYDTQKAFDSVEYPVLLNRLYEAGVNGKTWRLLRSWYDGASCCVRCDGALSNSFKVERGVKQDSVLSPYTLPAGDGPFAEATGGFRAWPFSEQLLYWWVSTCRRYPNFG